MGEPQDFLRENYEAAQLQADLAKLDLILVEDRRDHGDARLSLGDVAAIRHAAREFGVPVHAAYLRAKELCCLSYQNEPSNAR